MKQGLNVKINNRRVIIVVLDSVGIGALPDAGLYGDEGADTLGHIAERNPGIKLPNLSSLGLGNIKPIKNIPPSSNPSACFGKMAEKSSGKDTIIGHWEIAGVITKRAFPVFPKGFPEEVIRNFERLAGRKVLGNKTASGTEIIKELGSEHIKTGALIVYTSADSVFQIAAHEDVIAPEELYSICLKARKTLSGKYSVARVIARPFTGSEGNFVRTDRRKDFSIACPQETLLDNASKNGLKVLSIGKISDIFSSRGITESIKIHDNSDCCGHIVKSLNTKPCFSIIFANLIDFDMKYGHRNDVEGYKNALEQFDLRVPEITDSLKDNDLIIFTADHGNDPTAPGTDHTREYVPLLCYGKKLRKGVNIGIRDSFCDIAQTAAEFLGLPEMKNGKSFLKSVRS
ncbi:MAG: phosphopentomutase [bacterium]|nr:phosphopentomutase [bacterium]